MKRLFLLLVICCTTVQCEDFEIPEIEIDQAITRSDMNGYYQNVTIKYIKYEDSKAVGFESATPSLPWPIDQVSYFALVEDEVYYYLVTSYTPPTKDVVEAFMSDPYPSPVDLNAGKMATGAESYKSDIHKLTHDTIILVEPISEAMKRCGSNKNYTRSYEVYARITPDRELIKTLGVAYPMSYYQSFWDGYFKDKQ